jgi:hypothetical protein
MTTRLFRCAASALLAVILAPAAYAGDHGGHHYDPYAAARRAPVCTQAELRAGVDVGDCGRMLFRTAADGRKASRTTTD